MDPLTLPSLPAALHWTNRPVDWQLEADRRLRITAGADTDWFVDPAGAYARDNAPGALFAPPDESFLLSAHVAVRLAEPFDAGVLQVYARADLWAKLCLEYAPQRQPMIVSVVTRGVSDDCNGSPIDGSEVYLRVACTRRTVAFHYSRDGAYWHLIRYFTLGEVDRLQVGVSAQSPMGPGCTAVFSEIAYAPGTLADLRNGT